MRTLHLTLEEALEICKALSNERRITILNLLSEGPQNVNDLSEALEVPFSTAAVNIQKLEDAGLISTEIVPGRGSQKVSSRKYDRIVIDLRPDEPSHEQSILIDLPIGEYIDCEVEPTCGLVSDSGIIGIMDDPRTFYETERKGAQLLWFRAGYIEYRYPNRIPYGALAEELEFSAEICSEAPYHKLDWPSDITVWVNQVEIGTWTSPGDFGGERGFLTPQWWLTNNTQFGLLKRWLVSKRGTFLDGVRISDITLDDLNIEQKPFLSIRFGVKKDATNVGGLNLFGHRFGNYEQGIIMKIRYSNKR